MDDTSAMSFDSIRRKQSYTSSDEYSNDTMPVTTDATIITSPTSSESSKPILTSVVAYGPIVIRRRHIAAPTLATGRRSKDLVYEGDEAIKHEVRRMKNRESARNLRKLRDHIEHDLEATVDVLEGEERDLLTKIDNLQIYKQYLEEQCEKSSATCTAIPRTVEINTKRRKISRTVPLRNDHVEIKEERCSSPQQWQLSFSIEP